MDQEAPKIIIPRYRPSVEDQKKRYWQAKRWQKVAERRRGGLPLEPRQPIPPNSEPWLPHNPKSFAEIFFVSDQIDQEMQRWKIPKPNSSSTT